MICEHGPLDGILGSSQGGTLAVQLVIRYLVEDSFAMVQGLPLRFAIFINGATPPSVIPLTTGEPALED